MPKKSQCRALMLLPDPAPMAPTDTVDAPVAPADAPVPVLDVAAYQAMVFPSPPCWQLVAQVYADVLAQPVHEFKTVGGSVRSAAREFRLQLYKGRHGFEQISEPRDYAVVLLGKTQRTGVHHCGIFYGGSVLHALETGTLYQDLVTLADEYELMEFWSRE
jgi:hypothetical protein